MFRPRMSPLNWLLSWLGFLTGARAAWSKSWHDIWIGCSIERAPSMQGSTPGRKYPLQQMAMHMRQHHRQHRPCPVRHSSTQTIPISYHLKTLALDTLHEFLDWLLYKGCTIGLLNETLQHSCSYLCLLFYKETVWEGNRITHQQSCLHDSWRGKSCSKQKLLKYFGSFSIRSLPTKASLALCAWNLFTSPCIGSLSYEFFHAYFLLLYP